MATEAAIALLEKKRLDLPVLNDFYTALGQVQNDPTGCSLLIRLPNDTVVSLEALKNALQTNGAQQDAAIATIEAALQTAVGVAATPGSMAAAIYDLITAYNADIFAE